MKITAPILAMILSTQAFSATFNIDDRIKSQKVLLDNYSSVFGKRDFAHRNSFLELVKDLKRSDKKKVTAIVKALDKTVPDALLRPLVYWRSIKENKSNLASVLYYTKAYKLFILRDFIDNPVIDDEKKVEALSLLKELTGDNDITTNSISKHFDDLKKSAEQLANVDDDIQFVKMLLNDPIVKVNLKEQVPEISEYSLSALGFLPSNQTEIVSENKIDLERIDWLNQRVMFAGGKLDFDAPYIKMPTKEDPEGHIIFKEDPIYMKIREMIDRAEHSVFIDIFLFGGTLGATLSEYLLDETLKKLKKDPNFKVTILHDYATNYNMVEEMVPIFQYIQKRIKEDPKLNKSVSLLQANIQRHPPGIPLGITELIPKDDNTFKYFETGNTYYESKIDHSKVIVVDGNYDDAEAYFGSKNWTDHSGGYYYDDAIYVTGPAAALVQASYYRDIEAALTTDPKELARMYYKELELDNRKYLPRAKEILDSVRITKKEYKLENPTTVRIAEADVDGTIKNVRNMLVDMIQNAKKNIYMEQLFLYDPYIIDALIKKKAQHPEVDMKIVIDHNGNFGMNGLPNTIFIKQLVDQGIDVRARKTYGIKAEFPDGTHKEYHQENHRKITSVDGRIVLGGSSNINPDTLQGSFREFGAQVYDIKEVKSFDKRFLADWKDAEKMEKLDIENFEANILGKLFDKRTSALLNSVAAMFFRAKAELEKRF
ncbi:phosphatidylserine/phosphatidylglycerophosphate/cardiolipin synthase family protein [Bacteriovorax sp. Seq25_V]|uniref:phospholipase D-like domain-containing protein n=1 Tax=Bacteriovorax sp. Seq25_V TaxID=1201288 RepID=UPI000389EC96|nr:phospholipase D-like domain-containing protein [Bacteriovorax sp. Seq25_V]EQC45643.1 PLD-like domain protein [Bacteriovorax sp. Seq25_V]